MLWNYKSLYPTAGYCITRENVISTNVGQLLERRGKEFLGPKYKDPISSFSDFQEFSVSNPEVVRMSHQRCLSLSLSLSIYIYIYIYVYVYFEK
jgi:hypothetical protein